MSEFGETIPHEISQEHELYGQHVEVLDGDTFVGIGVIDYAIGERFRVTLPNGATIRQPTGWVHFTADRNSTMIVRDTLP